jgi:hypothetical protein
MSRAYPLPPASRPTVFDYLVLLLGCCLSLYLMELSPINVRAQESITNANARELVHLLPKPMRLPEGIILMWPLFIIGQWMLGRAQPLTAGEWLWVFAWFGVALLTALGAWETYGRDSIPEFLQPILLGRYRPRYLWYLIFVPSLAVLAALFLLTGFLSRTPPPWTHPLSLVLVAWPALPLAGILMFGQFE